jgi:ubiquitin-conjugating enzyme E2 D/E
MIGLTSRRIL